MGRLKPELLERVESFADRGLDVAEELCKRKVHGRIVNQVIGSVTSVGANVFEADESMSRADFCKSLGISIKESNESRFWVRLIARRGWIEPQRLRSLEQESVELKKLLGAIAVRSRRSGKTSNGQRREPLASQ
jgi:four helix bundle protein